MDEKKSTIDTNDTDEFLFWFTIPMQLFTCFINIANIKNDEVICTRLHNDYCSKALTFFKSGGRMRRKKNSFGSLKNSGEYGKTSNGINLVNSQHSNNHFFQSLFAFERRHFPSFAPDTHTFNILQLNSINKYNILI
jgi:hypothetical protein